MDPDTVTHAIAYDNSYAQLATTRTSDLYRLLFLEAIKTKEIEERLCYVFKLEMQILISHVERFLRVPCVELRLRGVNTLKIKVQDFVNYEFEFTVS